MNVLINIFSWASFGILLVICLGFIFGLILVIGEANQEIKNRDGKRRKHK